VAVTLRDGTIIYIDIYRPEGETNIPAILAWSAFGKRASFAPAPEMLPHGVPPGTVSPMCKFESADPAYWCHYGYAVINADSRGIGNSGGNVCPLSCTQEGRDGADLVEWVAARDWCNGKIGMAGNSGPAMAQWWIAAEQPPHLACIAPWEATSDSYRELIASGGFPEVGFMGRMVGILCGPGYTEDVVVMIRK